MDIISYRGPGAAGGVSSGIASAWRAQQQSHKASWWFLSDCVLNVMGSDKGAESRFITQLGDEIVQGHYRYCNEFLWPILHDLPNYVSYDPSDRALYQQFNRIFEQFISFERASQHYFVQDYQLAILPALLASQGIASSIFWHIPWPKQVPEQYVEPMAEIARGLLSCTVVGFHTEEYTSNFINFVHAHLSKDFEVDFKRSLVQERSGKQKNNLLAMNADEPYVLRPYRNTRVMAGPSLTKVVARPLGISVAQWQNMVASNDGHTLGQKVDMNLLEKPFILSVDRADYTKAVADRLQIINQFFDRRPDLRGQISFVQICGRSRSGLQAFDRYFNQCRNLCQQVNDRWGMDDWQPVRWIEPSLNAPELARLYGKATAMLVNPVRDGLNLTAKEFIASQSKDPGVLLLSPGAGAWHEIGEFCLPAPPTDPERVMNSLDRALAMGESERRSRNMLGKARLERNSLDLWWRYFVTASTARSLRTAGSAAEQQTRMPRVKSA